MTARVGNVTIYAHDPARLAEFWSALMGYDYQPGYPADMEAELRASGLTDDDLAARAVAWDFDPAHQRFFFHRSAREKTQRNWMHVDINMFEDRRATPAELDAERDRLLSIGAELERTIDTSWGPYPEYFHMMRDPEGNEFCLH